LAERGILAMAVCVALAAPLPGKGRDERKPLQSEAARHARVLPSLPLTVVVCGHEQRI
jgi:hypothetical protein